MSGARCEGHAPLALGLALLLAACGGKSGFDAGAGQAKFDELKAKVQAQADALESMKVAGAVREAESGYVLAAESVSLPLEQRKELQQENYLREQIFALVGERVGQSREQVAHTFAELARRKETAVPPPAP